MGCGFASRFGAVVTRCATTRRDTRVVKGRRFPRRSTVAAITRKRGCHVRGSLARRSRAIVTSCACTRRDAAVAECRGLPGCGSMTSIARKRGWNM
jgi:hypothetical protein